MLDSLIVYLPLGADCRSASLYHVSLAACVCIITWCLCFFYCLVHLHLWLFVVTNMVIFSSTACRFQQNLASYQNLITQSMYDKQLDSGKGTLLHLCDDVIQQEVSCMNFRYYCLCGGSLLPLLSLTHSSR